MSLNKLLFICGPYEAAVCFSVTRQLETQGDQKVSVHLMITINKVTSSVQSVPRPSPDIY
jgi:hypothetical protein